MYENPQQPEIMRERYSQLPPEITELFEYATVDKVLEDVTKEFALNEEQVGVLRAEIELVLYLFMPRAGFVDRVAETLEIDVTKANALAQKINSDLFIIVNDLLSFVETQFETTTSETPTTTQNSEPETTPNEKVTGYIPPMATPGTSQTAAAPSPGLKQIRTFADDVNLSRVHGYGVFSNTQSEEKEDEETIHRSSQDDIIKKWDSRFRNSLK